MKKKLLPIDSCDQCNHQIEGDCMHDAAPRMVFHSDKPNSNNLSQFNGKFPEWCPLEDEIDLAADASDKYCDSKEIR